jgi:hypothetical protein
MSLTRAALLFVLLSGAGWFTLQRLYSARPLPVETHRQGATHSNIAEPLPPSKLGTGRPPKQGTEVGKRDWGFEYQSTTDYFSFVSRAAGAALAGDGRAAYFISKALRSCATIKALYAGANDPEATLNSELAQLPTWAADMQRIRFQSCRGFLRGDAFAHLPQTGEDYHRTAFWFDLAYQGQDPIAQAYHAARDIADAQTSKSPTVATTLMSAAQRDIDDAVVSGDAASLFEIGSILSNGHGVDRLQGFAIAIVACDFGYDCSAETNDQYFGACVTTDLDLRRLALVIGIWPRRSE